MDIGLRIRWLRKLVFISSSSLARSLWSAELARFASDPPFFLSQVYILRFLLLLFSCP